MSDDAPRAMAEDGSSLDGSLVSLGVIAKPHGVGGELRVHRYNEESTVLLTVRQVWLRSTAAMGDGDADADADADGGTRRVKVIRARPGPKGLVLMTLAGVSGREAADALRGVEVAVPRAALPDTDDGEWYHVDLIGLHTVDASGETLGEVTAVVTYPSIDCLVVRMEDGVREVPLVAPWLVDVDVAAGTVSVGDIRKLPVQPEKSPKTPKTPKSRKSRKSRKPREPREPSGAS